MKDIKKEGGIKMKEMNKYLKIILKEMCRRVGADFKKIDVTKKDWFMEYKWTVIEMADFKNWLVDYLYNNNEAREAIVEVNIKRKKHLKKVADMFTFTYGWSLKNE
jgi:hypothetical protein